MDLADSSGLIIGADTPFGSALARAARAAGAASLALCGLGPGGALGAGGAGFDKRYCLEGEDPIELARLFGCVRHDHGPLDWVCCVTGPAATAPARSAQLDVNWVESPPRWPQLSLARIVARVEQSFLRAALVTRLAEEEFRPRGGALLHVWDALPAWETPGQNPLEPTDALWSACRAGLANLVCQGGAAPAEAAMRLGWYDTAERPGEDPVDALNQLLGADRAALSR